MRDRRADEFHMAIARLEKTSLQASVWRGNSSEAFGGRVRDQADWPIGTAP